MLSKTKETERKEVEDRAHLESLEECDQESDQDNVHGDFQEIANKIIVRHREALLALSR